MKIENRIPSFVHGALCLGVASLLATNAFAINKKKFDFVVGVNGDFKAAMNAAKSASTSESNHFIIFFPDGNYDIGSLTGDENQMTTFPTSNVSIVGQSADKTVLFNKSINEGISVTATLKISANNVYMQDITLYNKANYGNEDNCGSACRHDALMTVGDKLVYKNVKLLSTQDTYYTKLNGGKGRSYWEGGQIEGTVDFICGDGDVFFEGTNLVMRRKGGYITASQNNTNWGYVFNNTTITVTNSSFNKTFYLGRSWGTARTVFLNTKMVAQPIAEGWQKNMNSAPKVFGEYNSKDGNGNAVDVSKRRTYFDGSKDGSTATLKTVWDANDAAKYTRSNVLSGTDSWAPEKLTAQVAAPQISQNGANLVWTDDANALCYVVFVDGKYKTNVTANSFSLSGIAAGSKVTVRAANAMGGLGESSNAVTVQDANLTYYSISATASVGGIIVQEPEGEKLAEGTEVTFTAVPLDGWKHNGWDGDAAASSALVWKTTVTKNITLSASFTPIDKLNYEAESGTLTNAVFESTNAGFSGSGYVNFGAGDPSSTSIPVFADAEGEFELTLTFANGSNAARSLSVKTEKTAAQELSFETTGGWTTWQTKTLKVTFPEGLSYVTATTVGGNDGPNLDKIALKSLSNDTSTTVIAANPNFGSATIPGYHAYLLNTKGQVVRESSSKAISTQDLAPGVYLLKATAPGYRMQKTIRVE